MASAVGSLSQSLGISSRTCRRAAAEGTLRLSRRGPRRSEVDVDERTALERIWPTLSRLRRAFRTEPAVAAAVLFGSTARAVNRPDSDLDIVVVTRGERDLLWSCDLAARLSRRMGRRVDLYSYATLQHDPEALLQIITDGRVIVDRDNVWPRLQRRRSQLARRAEQVERQRQVLFTVDHG
jgi:predicted nucleotidyltransferase